jgi:hypothetical protein
MYQEGRHTLNMRSCSRDALTSTLSIGQGDGTYLLSTRWTTPIALQTLPHTISASERVAAWEDDALDLDFPADLAVSNIELISPNGD